MWQFARAIDGMRDACERLGVPITGGNVSFYNETEGQGIFPTPVVGVVGIIEDKAKRLSHHFRRAGDLVYLLGETREELGASEYLKVVHERIEGAPPALDLEAEVALHELVREAAASGLLRSAHDLSEGGLGAAVGESLFGPLGETMGATVALETPRRADVVLFSESQGRMLVTLPSESSERFLRLAEERYVPVSHIGVTGGSRLEIQVNGATAVSRDVDELRDVWWNAIERGLRS
jgi:phosphoribosylformylglycinamidine synthase